MLGGDLTVSSIIGEGSVFTFEIVVSLGNQKELKGKFKAKRAISLVPGQYMPRVLITDDKEEARSVLVQLLNLIGFETKEASSGREAIEVYKLWKPDFIWMDIRMLDMNGLEATRHIRQLDGGNSVVIVAITASTWEEERQIVLASGFDDFVRKPFYDYEILEIMAKHLGVRYIYEEEVNDADYTVQDKNIDIEKIEAVVPIELENQLKEAVVRLNRTKTVEIIDEIFKIDSNIGKYLKDLAENLEYDRILTILEKKEY